MRLNCFQSILSDLLSHREKLHDVPRHPPSSVGKLILFSDRGKLAEQRNTKGSKLERRQIHICLHVNCSVNTLSVLSIIIIRLCSLLNLLLSLRLEAFLPPHRLPTTNNVIGNRLLFAPSSLYQVSDP